MDPVRIEVLDEERLTSTQGSLIAGRFLASPAEVERGLGWSLKPQGLCKDEICVPVAERNSLLRDGKIDLAALAESLGRPLAADPEEAVICLGAPAAERGETLRSGIAPDFELPDLSGKLHSLASHRGRKVLLIAYASW